MPHSTDPTSKAISVRFCWVVCFVLITSGVKGQAIAF